MTAPIEVAREVFRDSQPGCAHRKMARSLSETIGPGEASQVPVPHARDAIQRMRGHSPHVSAAEAARTAYRALEMPAEITRATAMAPIPFLKTRSHSRAAYFQVFLPRVRTGDGMTVASIFCSPLLTKGHPELKVPEKYQESVLNV